MRPEPERDAESAEESSSPEHWRRHGPHWMRVWDDANHRPWGGGRPPWMDKRRFLFRRFAGFIGMVALLFLLAMGGLAFLLTRLAGGDSETTVLVWMAGCGLALAFPLTAGALAARSFRRFADPLARVMAAADQVADGDLSARVPDSGPGEIGRLERSFNRMVSELERSDRLRRDLTADVAHELRTPIHILQGNLEGILDGVYQPSPEQIELLLDETRQLARLVEDLRTLSLAEAGQLTLVKESIDLAELLRDAATSFSAPIQAAKVSLRVEFEPEDRPVIIQGDAGRLDQVLGNLIGNALRHTSPGGTITLRLERISEGKARIQVRDDGDGIAAEDLPYVFDRFWRANRESKSAGSGLGVPSPAGSGLGLAIARQLVQAHGGRIAVESRPGEGTVFTIEL